MQLINNLAAVAALVATASAGADFASDPNQYNGNSSCNAASNKIARVHNRCSYPVYLWSVLKGQGCPSDQAAIIQPGGYYHENYRPAYDDAGVSLKISKSDKCAGVDITQLEYYINDDAKYGGNYLDVSFVNCPGRTCPGAENGYYLKSGNNGSPDQASATDNEHCPILSCDSWDTCAQCSYVNPDDRQTKSCIIDAALDFYVCGGEAPGSEPSYSPPSSSPAKPSSKAAASSKAPVSSSPAPSSTEAYIQKAAVTSAPVESKPYNVKTEVVYVTQYEYVNAKRHAHGHRHQQFRA